MDLNEDNSKDYSYYVEFSETELKTLKTTYENRIKNLKKIIG